MRESNNINIKFKKMQSNQSLGSLQFNKETYEVMSSEQGQPETHKEELQIFCPAAVNVQQESASKEESACRQSSNILRDVPAAIQTTQTIQNKEQQLSQELLINNHDSPNPKEIEPQELPCEVSYIYQDKSELKIIQTTLPTHNEEDAQKMQPRITSALDKEKPVLKEQPMKPFLKKQEVLLPCQRFAIQKNGSKKSKSDLGQKKNQEKQPKIIQKEEEDEIIQTTPQFEEFLRDCKVNLSEAKCLGGHKSTMVCAEKVCQEISFICSEPECSSCPTKHKSCVIRFTVQMLTEALNRNIQRQQSVAKEIFAVQEVIEKALTENKTLIENFLCLQGTSSQVRNRVIQQSSKNQINLRSCDILTMLQDFAKETTHEKHRLSFIHGQTKKDKESIKDIFERRLKLALQTFNVEEMITLPSHLVTARPEISFILEQLNFPKEIRLAYRASEHELSLDKYHQLCDNLENTFTVIKTEHEKLVGAFTPLRLNNKLGRDKSNRTFLLAINLREKLEHTHNGQCAITYDKDLGPCFGGLFEQRDIQVFKENGLLQVSTNFPNTFNWKKQFVSCQESWRFLTGVKNVKVCQVMDFEVFQVIPRA